MPIYPVLAVPRFDCKADRTIASRSGRVILTFAHPKLSGVAGLIFERSPDGRHDLRSKFSGPGACKMVVVEIIRDVLIRVDATPD